MLGQNQNPKKRVAARRAATLFWVLCPDTLGESHTVICNHNRLPEFY